MVQDVLIHRATLTLALPERKQSQKSHGVSVCEDGALNYSKGTKFPPAKAKQVSSDDVSCKILTLHMQESCRLYLIWF